MDFDFAGLGHAPLVDVTATQTPSYVALLYRIAYSFHMPLFIFVSGYLFYMTRISKQWGYRKMLSDKAIRLGVPFLFFTLVAMVIKFYFAADMARPTQISLGTFVNAVLFPYDGPMREFWFIAVLFWLFAAMPIWRKLLESKRLTIIGLIITLLLAVWNPPFMNGLLCISSVLRFSIYFFLGAVCYRCGIIERLKEKLIPVSVVSIVGFTVLFLIRMPAVILLPLCGITLSTCLAIALEHFVPWIFRTFREYTYQIYLMSIFCQIACKMLYNRNLLSYRGGGIYYVFSQDFTYQCLHHCSYRRLTSPLYAY